MLVTRDISMKFEEGGFLTFPDIQLKSDTQCVLTGDSGSGKTTLLHIIGGLISVNSGVVNLNGQNLLDMKPNQKDIFRGQNIGFVFQKSHLINALNVYENIAIAQRLANVKEDDKLIMNALTDLGLIEKVYAKISSLSHGQAQRVAIARAMINRPQLILADEPTASLDDTHAVAAIRMLKSQATKFKASLIIATHDNRVKEMFDQQIILPRHEHA